MKSNFTGDTKSKKFKEIIKIVHKCDLDVIALP